MSYFSKFPTITYNGQTVTDVTRRVKLAKSLRSIPTAFYPYELTHDTRADTLSYLYYDDPAMHWLIYITNGIVDPYYGWFLTDEQLGEHIIEKYGSIEVAQRRIKLWRTNWSDNDVAVSVSYFENNANERIQKYYIPNYGPGTKILSYRRRQEDWVIATNRIISMDLTNASVFEVGDVVSSVDNFPTAGNVIGSGEIVAIDGNTVWIKDVIDDFTTAIVKVSDHKVGSLLNAASVTIVTQPLSDEETVFWQPISCYEWETEQNALNGTVLLLDKNYSYEAAEQLEKKLNTPFT